MEYPVPGMFFPRSHLKGIGDEANGPYVHSFQPVKICSHKIKRDEHASVPRELVSYAKAVNMKARG